MNEQKPLEEDADPFVGLDLPDDPEPTEYIDRTIEEYKRRGKLLEFFGYMTQSVELDASGKPI
jgi:hypothetical protein